MEFLKCAPNETVCDSFIATCTCQVQRLKPIPVIDIVVVCNIIAVITAGPPSPREYCAEMLLSWL
jgi:hypothetical protein